MPASHQQPRKRNGVEMNLDTLAGIFIGVAVTLVAEALFVTWIVQGSKDFKRYE